MRHGILLSSLMIVLPVTVPAQTTVAELVSGVRSALQQHKLDSEVARLVAGYKLAEQLPDAVVEQLKSEGAGPDTMSRFDWQQTITAGLPRPATLPVLFDAPPAPTDDQQKTIIEKAREWALQFSSGLPDFIATETVSRSSAKKNSQFWAPQDTLTMSVAFSQKTRERYKLLTINGKPTKKDLSEAGGFTSYGEFGTGLQFLFDPASKTQFLWDRWTMLDGRPTYVFSYKVDLAHSTYTLTLLNKRIRSAMKGYVYLDRDSLQAMRLTAEADGFPPEWGEMKTLTVVDYAYAEVAGERHLLPRRTYSRLMQGAVRQRNVTEFSDYRKFSAETTVSFGKE